MLGGERVVVVPRCFLDPEIRDARHFLTDPTPDDRQFARREIGGEVNIAREDPHPPLGPDRYPAGGDGGHRAVDETQAGVGDVLEGAGDRRAHGLDRLDRTVDQRQYQIQIVDHQIQNDRHVGPARLERRDPHRLDIQRRPGARGQGLVGGRKPLQMPDLQHQLVRDGQRGQFVGFRQSRGDRLFHQHMLAGAQGGGGHGVVGIRRCRDNQRVDRGQQRRERHVRRAGFPADGFGPFGVRVENAGQMGARGRRHLQGVIAAEMTGTGDADAKRGGEHARLDEVRFSIAR